MGLVGACSAFRDLWESCELLDDIDLPGIVEQRQVGSGERRCVRHYSGENFSRIANHRMRAGVSILNVENRIVLRLLQYLGEIEIEWCIVLAIEHHVADGV